MKLCAAGFQMAVVKDVQQNVASIVQAIEQTSTAGAHILLTPEGSLSGYTHEFDAAVVEDALVKVTSAARQSDIGLALGTCFREADGKRYNQVRFYARDGAYLGYHSKILRTGPPGGPTRGEVTRFATTDLRTFVFEGITVGGLICNDMWANPCCTPVPDPNLSRQLAGMGAQIIFHAVSGGRKGDEWSEVAWRYHESNLRMRARAARCWIVTVDNSHPTDIPCSAPSGVLDPEGKWVLRAEPQGEHLFVHTFEL